MPPKKLHRNYRMNDPDLKQRGDLLLISMERDQADFATRNIGADDRAELTALLDTLFDIPDEEQGRGFLSGYTQQRNEIADELRKSIAAIRIIAESRYGTSGKYRRFGFTGMHKLDDNGLHRLARRIVRIGTELLTELVTRGLTEGMLDEFEALNASFDEAIEKVHDTEVKGLLDTEARITHGNAVWEMMAQFALVGKGLFQDNDEARYRHYVLEG